MSEPESKPGSRRARAALALLAALSITVAARAETPKPTDPEAIQRANEERERRAENLKRVQDALAASAGQRAQFESEIAAIGSDRAKLDTALLDANRQAQATEDRLSRLEERLKAMSESEAAIRHSLQGRRGIVAEILAALQRMGRRPPPAVLVSPEDVLAAIRTSMLLGAVVPELRGEVDTLAADLAEMIRLRGLIAQDKEGLSNDLAGWAREQQRLQALVAARRARQAEVESGLTAERRRATELGAQAKNLKDLLDRTEAEVAAAKRSAEEAKAAAEREVRITQERFAAAGFRDPARLAPKVHFAEARGEVPRPVSGRVARGFNQPDGNGGTTRGVSFTTRPKASVSSPADGWVQFAGPFRSYGQLLIINAGDGYYLLLAGMDQISVEVGQFVLAGEPVGSMGDRGGGPGGSEGDPTLYVEFKKDGGSIDPEPWWAKSPNNTVLGEKVRG
ncbi:MULTISPECIES: peptidoglycan DD-metalloendopeptidase family protein [Methylobacterium]|uniref:murein hydrolase activator EnvC family protein n=1 Tax=Methylobacterium TaxID=407 RepID=UPI00036A3C13|nr:MULTISPECIES: peptidoglycan DD-metalloendopeptidase family protein [unclassified Methylobacterium]MBN4093650.1 peptidoglycan DD-metalloendopeptidase family protein [Methylobacterium sp. OT2]SEF55837.1 Septal ring factor EnvC, activator of murein hydrolases AmiA and AmiB [Methylobacterium sp. 190mf]SFS31435.1 Septal ring factor EnvC, activator of murein hydrolases AmiA and AmiB [Methylobacterium sp. yr668]